MKLTEIEVEQMRRLIHGDNICSSDRPSDRARTNLKKAGFIKFDRSAWLWRITDAGRAALEQSKEK